MNRLLADLLSAINLFIALAMVVVGGVIGFQMARNAGDNITFGMGVGAIVGLLAAAVLCGILAVLILIERHLRLIADDVDEMRRKSSS